MRLRRLPGTESLFFVGSLPCSLEVWCVDDSATTLVFLIGMDVALLWGRRLADDENCIDDLSFRDNKEFHNQAREEVIGVNQQSFDIEGGVHVGNDHVPVSADDQGIKFVYSSGESDATMFLAHIDQEARRHVLRNHSGQKWALCDWPGEYGDVLGLRL